MSNVRIKVGKRIRQLRLEKGLTQEEAGEKANFHYTYWGRLERGEKNISVDNLEKIANVLGVGVHQLFSFAFELEELTQTEQDAKEILDIIMKLDREDIKKAKNILKEVFTNRNAND